MKAKISEIFESVQGEGLYLGEKQVFVRFFGCNLNCSFCDTSQNYFVEYEPGELFEDIALYNGPLHSVSFTGGEPLLQVDSLEEILKLTSYNGYRNYLETNGTLPGELRRVIKYVDIVAMDLKLPSSTGIGSFWGIHRKFLKVAQAKEVFLKAVICHDTREEDIKEAISLVKDSRRQAVLVLQPNSYEDSPELRSKTELFKGMCLKEDIAACIIPQMHKLIGVK
ncbi:MAG: 7-carboxy-7-deazaguanine synthase QueE [Candidatus Omnitrophota bacterium]